MGSFIWPLPGCSRISSYYGYRIHPISKKRSFHAGIDIPAASGTIIYAARAGTVSQARYAGSYGNMILLDHGGGTRTRYAHMSVFLVKAGEKVSAGQAIGHVGSTGNSTAPHLHFEVHINRGTVNPLSCVTSKDTKANYSGALAVSNSGTSAASAAAAIVHIPQTEKIYTQYDSDAQRKALDVYTVTWQSLTKGTCQDITARVGGLTLTDDADSLCLELDFRVLGVSGDYFMEPLKLACGDYIAVVNHGNEPGECIFLGQVQTVDGSYRGEMAVTCLDAGRLLTTNDVILQFNNVSAKTAIAQIAAKVGIQAVSCPNLVSSVYGIYKDSAASIIQSILETVTAENGVNYFPRMMGNTLVIRSFGEDCIRGFFKQAPNLRAFDILDEASDPQVRWDISDLRNAVTVYSEDDSSVSVKATAEDATSIQLYGRRQDLETFSDQDTVSAAAKAKTTLATLNRVTEEVSVTTYGSDRIVAGCRLAVDLAEVRGEFWVTAVTHDLGTPHRMTMTLRRAT